MSGMGGHGGTVDLSTYLVASGIGHGDVAGVPGKTALFIIFGPTAWSTDGIARGHPQVGLHLLHIGHCMAGAQPDGFATWHLQFTLGFPHTLHSLGDSKPSVLPDLRPRK
jgi:hypothetical protein